MPLHDTCCYMKLEYPWRMGNTLLSDEYTNDRLINKNAHNKNDQMFYLARIQSSEKYGLFECIRRFHVNVIFCVSAYEVNARSR